MKKSKGWLITVLAIIGMLIMILDSKLVLRGAVEGIKLCLWTILPSLFPFVVISSVINSRISCTNIGFFRFLGKVLKIPAGSEHIVLVGYLGGYPIGAQSVTQAQNAGNLTTKEATRLLMFCNNAGPAFIFGMIPQLFDSVVVGWYLWFITILSSLLVAASVPGSSSLKCHTQHPTILTFPQIISNAVKTMSNICSWVVLFKILLMILQKRLFLEKNPLLETLFCGFLELSNGVIQSASISSPQLRFVLCAVFLNAGGFCVAMQTYSVTQGFGFRSYIIGKVLQALYTLLISVTLVPIIFHTEQPMISLLSVLICITLFIFAQLFKKSIAFSEKVLYYIENSLY